MSKSARVATISLNPAIDQTARVRNFAAGTVNRVEWQQSDAGGKGVNVASFLSDAGVPAVVTGVLGLANVAPFVHLFEEKGIVDRFVRAPGQTRVNVKIVDEAQDQVTDINFPGLSVGDRELADLADTVDDLCSTIDWFVLSGSVPAGVPEHIYADLVARLKDRGKTIVLDASGPSFARAVRAAPDLIKPNIDELQELVGRHLADEAAIVDAARQLVTGQFGGGRAGAGIALVAVSMGAQGAVFVSADEALHAQPPSITVKSTVGAGDAMVAGLIAGALRGIDLAGRARLGTAFSMGALSEIGPRLPSVARIETFAKDVTIRRISVTES